MDKVDLELAEIEFLREVMLAEYEVTNQRWQGVQLSGVGAAGIGVVGYLGQALTAGASKHCWLPAQGRSSWLRG